MGADGTVYLPKDACEEPFLFRSEDEGLTWEGTRVSKTALPYGPDPAVAVDKKGYAELARLYFILHSDHESNPSLSTLTP